MLNEKSRELNLEVVECSEEVAEVTALGGSGFRFVVNLHDRTCSCRQWPVSGIPCKHAIAFITSLSNAALENYVDQYYSIDKFRVAYAQLIPAMIDKSHWPKASHGFFMHPPLLKPTAGRHKIERHKGCTDKKRKNGQHHCPICLDYDHHWHNCKRGNPDDIAAMMAERGPPKKRAKKAKTAQPSIVPCDAEAPATSMSFPPRQSLETTANTHDKEVNLGSASTNSLETTSKKKRKHVNSNAGASKRSRSGSNQLEPLSTELADITKEATGSKAKTKRTKKTNYKEEN